MIPANDFVIYVEDYSSKASHSTIVYFGVRVTPEARKSLTALSGAGVSVKEAQDENSFTIVANPCYDRKTVASHIKASLEGMGLSGKVVG